MRKQDIKIYSLQNPYDFGSLLSQIRGNNIVTGGNHTLTPENFIMSLNESERLKILNYDQQGRGTILYYCIVSERESEKLEFFKIALENSAILTTTELDFLLGGYKLSAELQPEFFQLAKEHLYQRFETITGLEDESFAHIQKIEHFLSLYKGEGFGKVLIDSGFPEEFRNKLAPILIKANITIDEFVAKLCSFAPEKREGYSISRESKERWRELLEPALSVDKIEIDTAPNSDESSRESSNEFKDQDRTELKAEDVVSGLRQRHVTKQGEHEKESDEKTALLGEGNDGNSSSYHQDQVSKDGLHNLWGLWK